jgi:hypothetical protein
MGFISPIMLAIRAFAAVSILPISWLLQKGHARITKSYKFYDNVTEVLDVRFMMKYWCCVSQHACDACIRCCLNNPHVLIVTKALQFWFTENTLSQQRSHIHTHTHTNTQKQPYQTHTHTHKHTHTHTHTHTRVHLYGKCTARWTQCRWPSLALGHFLGLVDKQYIIIVFLTHFRSSLCVCSHTRSC